MLVACCKAAAKDAAKQQSLEVHDLNKTASFDAEGNLKSKGEVRHIGTVWPPCDTFWLRHLAGPNRPCDVHAAQPGLGKLLCDPPATHNYRG